MKKAKQYSYLLVYCVLMFTLLVLPLVGCEEGDDSILEYDDALFSEEEQPTLIDKVANTTEMDLETTARLNSDDMIFQGGLTEEVSRFGSDPSYLVAQKKLDVCKQRPDVFGWGPDADIVDRFPIHIPGIDGISYYEYKVVDGSRDAGYVLVNINRTDILIPEMRTNGPTLTEAYRNELHDDNFVVVRYSHFDNAAKHFDGLDVGPIVAANFPSVTSGLKLFDSRPSGDDTSVLINEMDQRFQEMAASKKIFPSRDLARLDSYYQRLDDARPAAPSAKLLSTFQEILPHIMQGITEYVITPSWFQTHDPDLTPVGCGPTAWAILLAYWHQYKGYINLYNSRDLNLYNQMPYGYPPGGSPDFIGAHMWMIAGYLETLYGGQYFIEWYGQYGFTYPSKMCNIEDYIDNYGYPSSNCREVNASPSSNWNTAKIEILADRPVVLLYDNSNIFPQHYIVVEGIEGDGNNDLGYYVNLGNSAGFDYRTWIYDGEGGADISRVYTLTISDNSPYKPKYVSTIL